MERQKLSDLHSVQAIKDWTSQGDNHVPNEDGMARFVRDIIPYIEHLEKRIELLESKTD